MPYKHVFGYKSLDYLFVLKITEPVHSDGFLFFIKGQFAIFDNQK